MNDPSELHSKLTDKEFAILLKLAQGLTNAEIGTELNLSAGTINNRLGVIYKRLGVTNRTAAIATAINTRLFAN